MNPHIHPAAARHWRLRIMQLVFAVAAAFGMLALFDTSHPETTHTVIGSVRLTDVAVVSPLPATAPSLIGGGLATDDTDDQAQQHAQQDMQQSMQLAQEQNDAAEQQFNQDMQQEQTYENQFNNQ
jgi:hypothetical protein